MKDDLTFTTTVEAFEKVKYYIDKVANKLYKYNDEVKESVPSDISEGCYHQKRYYLIGILYTIEESMIDKAEGAAAVRIMEIRKKFTELDLSENVTILEFVGELEL